jgi:hypothetical protein
MHLIYNTPIRIITIVGLPRSGKSSFAQLFSSKFEVISAGEVVRSAFLIRFGRLGCRLELIEFGADLLLSIGPNGFAEMIAAEVAKRGERIIIEGIRPVRTVTALSSMLGRSFCFFVDAPLDQISARLDRESAGDANYAHEVLRREAELMSGSYEDVADFKILNDERSGTIANNWARSCAQLSLASVMGS